MAPERIVQAATDLGLDASQSKDVAAALKQIAKSAVTPRVLICGTLYLAGSILATDPQE
ncbi:MAG: bifunctional folylpolyglutamate synthase/dihydrofolate synthase, partial [Rhodospirillaceae bacterium]|nr:bifunctional folylpolyglutamate synthase/dihydrofolate synthase [Rhodospirillaceae bacterium]